jgi:hypothetical protein
MKSNKRNTSSLFSSLNKKAKEDNKNNKQAKKDDKNNKIVYKQKDKLYNRINISKMTLKTIHDITDR